MPVSRRTKLRLYNSMEYYLQKNGGKKKWKLEKFNLWHLIPVSKG